MDIRNNNISDITYVKDLKKLKTLAIGGNLIDCSPLRELNSNNMDIIKSLVDKGVAVEEIYRQRIDYDANKLSNAVIYKVLFVYTMDVDVEYDDGGILKKYQHSLSDVEINYFNEMSILFEKYIEKLSNYTIDIEVYNYFTTNPVTTFSVGFEGENIKNYSIMTENIPELEPMIGQYDSTFIYSIYDDTIPHNAGGLGGLVIMPDGRLNPSAMAYFNDFEFTEDNIELLKSEKYIGDLSGMLHEFTHTIEFYAIYREYNIWEFHSALAYYQAEYNDTTDIVAVSKYLQGSMNPSNDGSSGIKKEMIIITPSMFKMQEDSVLKSDTYNIDEDKMYIDLINHDTPLDIFRDKFNLNNGYEFRIDLLGKKHVYTGSTTQIYKDGVFVKEYTNIVKGDVNGDGQANSSDALRIRRHIVGLGTLEDAFIQAGDIDKNGLTSADALKIRRYIVGLGTM